MSESEDKRESIEFHYIKSNHFRVIHADGGIGGITPRGLFHIALYSERPAIPRLAVREVIDEEHVSEERIVETRGGIVRELEVDIFFDEKTATEIRDWINRRIEQFAEIRKQAERIDTGKDDG